MDAGRAAARGAGFSPQTQTAGSAAFVLHRNGGGGYIGAAPVAVAKPRAKAFVDWQNDVTAKDILLATREGFTSIEHVKRYTTTGMATAQGKLSNLTALGIVSGIQEESREGKEWVRPGRSWWQ